MSERVEKIVSQRARRNAYRLARLAIKQREEQIHRELAAQGDERARQIVTEGDTK